MLNKIKKRILESNQITPEELDNIINSDASILIDPEKLYDVEKLIDKLHQIKIKQQNNPKQLVIIDTDYDTDGILSACVLTASLAVFNINHRIYVPSMDNGYGLSEIAVDEMIDLFENDGYTIDTILTADNGTNAISGVEYAKSKGFTVLITDHHLGAGEYAKADALVNPNVAHDTYPYKGNAGATVAWKVMLAYARKYAPNDVSDIYNLIVFAGMANLSDVMPMTHENHFMTKEATKIINELKTPFGKFPYVRMGCDKYNMVIEGLQEFIINIQNIRNKDKGKTNLYPNNEEFISWYISPMLNAARRVNGTPLVAFKALLHHDEHIRHLNTEKLYELNKEKTILRDKALKEIDRSTLLPHSNVVLANCKHGISGIVASKLMEEIDKPTFIFSRTGDVLSCSARSTLLPLNEIGDIINDLNPNIILGGGGHANAAGYSIRKEDFQEFKQLCDDACILLIEKLKREEEELIKSGKQIVLPENRCVLTIGDHDDTLEHISIDLNKIHGHDIEQTINFLEDLRPYGRDFNIKPEFQLEIPIWCLKDTLDYNPNLWGGRAFKTTLNNIEVLTFNTKLSDYVKQADNQTVLKCEVKLNINHFNGKKTPQITLV